MAMPEQAITLVGAYSASRTPADLRGEIRIESVKRGNAITIVERRPPWKPEYGPEWSKTKVAQLRYDEAHGTWALYCSDSNGRWWLYDEVPPSRDVHALLAEIEADPTGIFWG